MLLCHHCNSICPLSANNKEIPVTSHGIAVLPDFLDINCQHTIPNTNIWCPQMRTMACGYNENTILDVRSLHLLRGSRTIFLSLHRQTFDYPVHDARLDPPSLPYNALRNSCLTNGEIPALTPWSPYHGGGYHVPRPGHTHSNVYVRSLPPPSHD